jgi:putative restriction endonuclease
VLSKKRIRDPDFRHRILEADERTCAICGYQIRREDQIIGLEAAHIKWHQLKEPDIEQNGIAMCTMHHRLFDYGLFGIDDSYVLKNIYQGQW